MDKPEWCSADIWSDALQVASPLPEGKGVPEVRKQREISDLIRGP